MTQLELRCGSVWGRAAVRHRYLRVVDWDEALSLASSPTHVAGGSPMQGRLSSAMIEALCSRD